MESVHTAKRRNSCKATPVIVEKYLEGIHYPARKDDLLTQAINNDAPEEVMRALTRFENKNYSSLMDVSREGEKLVNILNYNLLYRWFDMWPTNTNYNLSLSEGFWKDKKCLQTNFPILLKVAEGLYY